MRRSQSLILILVLAASLTGCLGTVVGAVSDVAVAVVKMPFKVGGAVVDVVTDDDDED
jgi:predicted small secreted protein